MHRVCPDPRSEGTCRHPATTSSEDAVFLTQPVANPQPPIPQSHVKQGCSLRALPALNSHIYMQLSPRIPRWPRAITVTAGACCHCVCTLFSKELDKGHVGSGACSVPAVESKAPLFSAQAGLPQGLTQDQERAGWWCRYVLTLPALAARTQVPQTQSRMESERKKSMLTWLVPILWGWRQWSRAPWKGLVLPPPVASPRGA